MKVYDVVPLGERQFVLNFWPIEGFLEEFEPGQHYTATCIIILSNGDASPYDCVVRRDRKRNFANDLVDHVYIVVQTNLDAEALASATYQMTHIGKEISEREASAWIRLL